MIKKQLSVLAGSVMAAAGANAAITLGEDALAVFNLSGGGSFYQIIDAGIVTGNSLAAGNGFSLDLTAASTALGGIESYAVLALATGDGIGGIEDYNYSEFVYVDTGGGLVFAGNDATPTTNGALGNIIGNIDAFLAGANLGFNGEGSTGDFDGNANVAGFLNFGASQVVANLWQAGLNPTTDTQFVPVINPPGSQEGVYIESGSLSATSAVPVPAAAWLFGSALLGLGVVRRKR